MLTIAWDVDDVLNDLMRQWFTCEWLPAHPECALHYEDLKLNPPHTLLGIEEQAYLSSLDKFRDSTAGKNLTPNPDLLDWFREYGPRCRHLALTARPLETAPDAAFWVIRHFGKWIRCFGILPSRPGEDVPVYDRTKGEFLTWIKAGDILIDDTPRNREGVKALAFPQPWSGTSYTTFEFLRQLTGLVEKQ
jgi:hypothetical protein